MPTDLRVQTSHLLPLPLAQLLRRAHNAKSALDAHLTALSLWEAAVKLLGSAAVVRFADSGQPNDSLAERIRKLARPALGDWWALIRALVPELARSGNEAYARIDAFLLQGRRHDDLPALAGLDAALTQLLDNNKTSRSSVQLDRLFDRLVQHRNQFTGHGAPAAWSHNRHEELGRTILSALEELLSRLDVLAGQRLIYVAEVRQLHGCWLVQRHELMGDAPRRLPALELPRENAALLPDGGRVYLEGDSLTSLHPLVIFDLDTEAVYFLNSCRGRQGKRKTEYLCYTTGAVPVQPDQGRAQNELLSRLLGIAVEPAQAEAWADQATDAEPLPQDHAEASVRSIGEYELVSKLGHGGMGDVFRAWQPSLRRQVAVKVLRNSDDELARARFQREIRALGKVDHPNLVKVFTSGSDGEHFFYTMELVEGAPLQAVTDHLTANARGDLDVTVWQQALSTVHDSARRAEKPLSAGSSSREPRIPTPLPLEQRGEGASAPEEKGGETEIWRPGDQETGRRGDNETQPAKGAEPLPATHHSRLTTHSYVRHVVGLMQQVAGAVDALHQSGVLHRDIKPGNICVTADGSKAVLMDLGLAQLADDIEGRLTRTRQFVGTLRYASPQQVLAVGRLDRRTDVYSLGVTLWESLALAPLFGAGDQTPTPTLMEWILRREPERLSRLNHAVPRDLEAIVHKCLEKDADSRYGTAAELSADLQRWLEGSPVRARPVRGWERGWKWARRRPLVAGLMAAVAVAVLAGASLAVILAVRVQHHAVRADQEAAQLAETNEDLIVKERLANANKQLADKRFVQALDAYRALVFDVQGKLVHRPGTQELRKALLANAIQGLNTLVNDAAESQGAEHVSIWAHLTLGDVYLHLDGQSSKAAQECRRARDLAELRAAAEPADLQAQRDLAVSLEKLGAVSLQTADNNGALRYYQRSLEIFKKLALADGRAADRDLAISLENLGDVSVRMADTGDVEAALSYYRDSLEILRKLAAEDSETSPAQRDLSLALQKVGDMELQSGDSQAALGHFRDSVRIDRKLAAADPMNSQAQRDLSVSLNKLGDVSLQVDDSKTALSYYREGLKIARGLALADSGDARAQRDLSVSLNKLGDMMLQEQDSKSALGYFEESLEIRKKSAADDPLNFEAQTDLVIAYFKLNEAGQLALDFDAARKYLHEADNILSTLESEGKLKGTKFARWTKVVEEETEFCDAARKAIASLDGALGAPRPLVPLLLNIRAQALAKMGDHVQAALAAEKLAQWQPVEPSNLYNAACGYALCVAAIARTPGPLDEAAKEIRDRYIAVAMQLLAKVRQQRFFEKKENVNRLMADKELNSLRELQEFKKFLHELGGSQ